MIQRVFYEDWQMECCRTPFTVGDEVRWPVVPMTEPATWLPAGVALPVSVAEFHSDDAETVPVEGVVRRIQMVSLEFQQVGDRSYAPVAGSAEVRDVDACPAEFDHDGSDLPGRTDVGVLAEVETP